MNNTYSIIHSRLQSPKRGDKIKIKTVIDSFNKILAKRLLDDESVNLKNTIGVVQIQKIKDMRGIANKSASDLSQLEFRYIVSFGLKGIIDNIMKFKPSVTFKRKMKERMLIDQKQYRYVDK
jgi:nucleoid DNA-binding protein